MLSLVGDLSLTLRVAMSPLAHSDLLHAPILSFLSLLMAQSDKLSLLPKRDNISLTSERESLAPGGVSRPPKLRHTDYTSFLI